MWYHVSEPNTYLVVTGIGIKDVIIAKKRFVKPLQKVTKISITPFDFSMSLQAMTSEKLQFNLPAVFTIGPKNNPADLKKYAELLTGDSDGHVRLQKGVVATGGNHVQDIVKGVIEGETRSIVSNMTMEELFNNRKLFKDQVVKNVQAELEVFGLYIYNANVKELQDMGECLSGQYQRLVLCLITESTNGTSANEDQVTPDTSNLCHARLMKVLSPKHKSTSPMHA